MDLVYELKKASYVIPNEKEGDFLTVVNLSEAIELVKSCEAVDDKKIKDWISTENMVPAEHDSVLGWDGCSIYIVHREDNFPVETKWFVDVSDREITITHWMPLPKPPVNIL